MNKIKEKKAKNKTNEIETIFRIMVRQILDRMARNLKLQEEL